MGKPPKLPHHAPSAMKQIKDWARSRWRTLASIIGGIVLLLGGVKTSAESWVYIEPHWPASHQFVRDENKDTTLILRDLQIETASGKLEAAQEAKIKWGFELNKTQDEASKELIQNHLFELDSTINKLNKQIRMLNNLKGK